MKMYVLLGLLLKCFITVHGEMIQCFVGGIIDHDVEYDVNKERQQYCNELEKESVLQKSYIVTNSDTPFKHKSFLTNAVDTTIVEYWDNIVNMGTDMHRLKFHSKLLTMYKNSYDFSIEESMVFLMSSYSAVGIYYFTNNLIIARCVAQDGYNFFENQRNKLYESHTNITEVKIWEILTYLAKYEMNNSHEVLNIYYWNNDYNFRNLLYEFYELISKENGGYPGSYLFIYRRILLDIKEQGFFHSKAWITLGNLIKDKSITIYENHSDEKKLQIYIHLISSFYYMENDTNKEHIRLSFYNLIEALKISIFTSEDRLLNYKVTVLAMNMISKCVDKNGWIMNIGDELCTTIQKYYRKLDSDIDVILTKLIQMQIYRIINNDFIPNCFHNDDTIDENNLHMIVTMAINNIDTNSALSLKNPIDIVNATITKLTEYIAKQKQSKKTKYDNLMIAYKWLVELYGVLCTDFANESSIITQQYKLEIALTEAIKIKEMSNINDDHLEFLFYKKMCNDSYPPFSWERHYKADGWIQKKSANFKTICNKASLLREDVCDVTKFLSKNNPFIHQVDIYILMARQAMQNDEHDLVIHYLENALARWVVSPEDRVRNLQAHELYSMYVTNDNYNTIKKLRLFIDTAHTEDVQNNQRKIIHEEIENSL